MPASTNGASQTSHSLSVYRPQGEIAIYMSNLIFGLKETDLIRAISTVVHAQSYGSFNKPKLVNFHVFLHPRKRHIRGRPVHGRTGILTFPHRDLAVKFLQEYGGSPPMIPLNVGGRQVSFKIGDKPARRDILETVRRMPFVDPGVIEEQEKLEQELLQRINIKTIQFGWDCRDEVFSVEWERHCLSTEQCFVDFDGDKRSLRVKLQGREETQIIVISFSQIDYTCISSVADTQVIFLSLLWPPMYELERKPVLNMLFDGVDVDVDVTVPRVRLSSLMDERHQEIAPYISQGIRLICSSPTDLTIFRHSSGRAHMQPPSSGNYPTAQRGLFSRKLLDELETWLSKVPWSVAFHVLSLHRNWLLDTKELLELQRLIDGLIRLKGIAFSADFLRRFHGDLNRLWVGDGSDLVSQNVIDCFGQSLKNFAPDKYAYDKAISEDQFDCLHVSVTPTCILPSGQYRERSNRVIRSYPGHEDSFLRVTFGEENGMPIRFDRDVDGAGFVHRRVGVILKEGILMAGRRFKFLAYSQSALKEHAVWFVKSFVDRRTKKTITAESIINALGNFDNIASDPRLMFCPARYGARLSQAFTATDTSISVEAEEIFTIGDITRNGSCFTDGVGTISRELIDAICTKMAVNKGVKHKGLPSRAIQIRFQGSKGMLSVDYKLIGRVICIRRSMIKFEAPDSLHVEIARAFDKPSRMFLNRPLIMLLEGLGVPAKVFLDLQAKAVSDVNQDTESLDKAARLLESHGLGASYRIPSVLLALNKLGVTIQDPFYNKLLEIAVNHIRRELKHRARIPVPGWTLVGVADVHDYLQEDEIYACVHETGSNRYYLSGDVLITRSPVIHPGDVRVVKALGRPPIDSPFAKERLENTVVFSIKGQRSLPSCLGGGDLDGDVYNVTEFSRLFPTRMSEPASYAAAPRKELDRPSTINDVADFVVDYIISDILGIIAITWLIIADQSSQSIFDPDCLILSQLHSDAVDYPKSGRPVPINKVPRYKFRAKPDWNAPETVVPGPNYYPSDRAIGKLFRAIELPDISIPQLSLRDARQQQDANTAGLNAALRRLTMDQHHLTDELYIAVYTKFDQYIHVGTVSREKDRLSHLFERFSGDLDYICRNHTLSRSRGARLTEEEAIIGTIVAKCSVPRKRNDTISKLREQATELVDFVREELTGDMDMSSRDLLRRAWAAWNLAIELIKTKTFGGRSFWWICLGAVFEAVRSIEAEERRG